MLPYYSVTIREESRTVDAIDENGAVIVSLLFENHAELCSEEFQMSLRDAVALASSDYGDVSDEQCDQDLMVVLWDEQMQYGGWDDEDQQMKTLLEVLEREELEKIREEEEKDRQFAIALQKQEEEDALERQRAERVQMKKSPWKTLCFEESQSSEIEGFPSLPAGTDPQTVSKLKPTGNILENMTMERPSWSLYRGDSDGDAAQVMEDWKKASHISSQIDDFRLYAVDEEDRGFILSAASSVMARRNKEEACPESVKKMMSGGSKKNEMQEVLEDVDRERYSRKSIRKLVLDMIAAGWMPLRRGGGHYIYERKVNIPHSAPLKQILVLPSTPSSQKSIDRVYAKLIKCDREVAEKILEKS